MDCCDSVESLAAPDTGGAAAPYQAHLHVPPRGAHKKDGGTVGNWGESLLDDTAQEKG